ncbi:sensor histidine kinase [Marinilabilia rubra]|uniref:histidine kinase n=1 Tax=Marinilabilia rubra TaxID=2162893 RepID=A0A2U2B427_9BACT|nr:PAS domain-containing sensor histidine kinase [Marinilabilia rubra]PWD97821.1 hypothetical protein DDZ16_18705 [Marinilabilia rubra]
MESTARVSENLFHLFADLSTIKEKGLLIASFTQKMGEIFEPTEFFYTKDVERSNHFFELKCGIKHWGFLEIVNGNEPTETALEFMQKAVRLFIFLLEGISSGNKNMYNQGFNSFSSTRGNFSLLEKEVDRLGISLKGQEFPPSYDTNKMESVEDISYNLLFETMSQGVVFQNSEGIITSINPSAVEILGLENHDVVGSRPLEDGWKMVDRYGNEILWEDLPSVVAIKENRPVKQKVVGVFNPAKENFKWLLLDSIPLLDVDNKTSNKVYTCFTDYTKQKKTEDQLLLLSHSVEQSPVSIIITDYDGNIEYVNPTFSKVTGYSFEEVRGQNPRIMKSGETSIELYEDLWDTILSGNKWSGELINKKKDGSFYWEQLFVSPLLHEDGKISHFVAIREDVSEKKSMIDNLVKAKEQAENSDRLKTAFLANISHEIRTPMNGILGFLELLRNPELNDEVKDQYIDIVNQSGDRLLRTINDLVEISKIESGQVDIEISTVYVPEIMDYYLQFFVPDVQKKHLGIKIAGQIENPGALIQTDRAKIEATLSNLLTNAIKFTEAGEIEFGNYIKDDNLVFFVKDSGVGIAPDHMDIVFERFVQADLNMTKPYQGTGLGLSIVKGYIEILGGKIWVESQEGIGSIFYFTIPYNPVKP